MTPSEKGFLRHVEDKILFWSLAVLVAVVFGYEAMPQEIRNCFGPGPCSDLSVEQRSQD